MKLRSLWLLGVVLLGWWWLQPRRAQAAIVTVPSNIPKGFDQPSSKDEGSFFRTQPNWQAYGYIIAADAEALPGGQPPPEPGEPDRGAGQSRALSPLRPLWAPDGKQYYYAIVKNSATVPMKASFDKYGAYYLSQVDIHTKMQQGNDPVVETTNNKLGINEELGIYGNFEEVWLGEEYDYIGYNLKFPKVSVPTWFRYQIDVVTTDTHKAFHSDLFPVLVVPDNWQPQLTATSRLVFNGQTSTVGLAGLTAELQPDYTWLGSPPPYTAVGNQLVLTDPAGAVGAAAVQASLTIPAHPLWGEAITYTSPPLALYQGQLTDQRVAFHDPATFNVVLPPGLTVQQHQWHVGAAPATGSATTLTLPQADQPAAVAWQAVVENAAGEQLSASAQAQLSVVYPDQLTLLQVPALTFLTRQNGQWRPPTVRELINGLFSGSVAPSSLPEADGAPWLVSQGGTLALLDGRTDPTTPWQLRVKVAAFHTQQTRLATTAKLTLLLTDDKEVMHTSAPIVAGAEQFTPLVTRSQMGRSRRYTVQAVMALAPIKAPVAGAYQAAVTWELGAVPEPDV